MKVISNNINQKESINESHFLKKNKKLKDYLLKKSNSILKWWNETLERIWYWNEF